QKAASAATATLDARNLIDGNGVGDLRTTLNGEVTGSTTRLADFSSRDTLLATKIAALQARGIDVSALQAAKTAASAAITTATATTASATTSADAALLAAQNAYDDGTASDAASLAATAQSSYSDGVDGTADALSKVAEADAAVDVTTAKAAAADAGSFANAAATASEAAAAKAALAQTQVKIVANLQAEVAGKTAVAGQSLASAEALVTIATARADAADDKAAAIAAIGAAGGTVDAVDNNTAATAAKSAAAADVGTINGIYATRVGGQSAAASSDREARALIDAAHDKAAIAKAALDSAQAQSATALGLSSDAATVKSAYGQLSLLTQLTTKLAGASVTAGQATELAKSIDDARAEIARLSSIVTTSKATAEAERVKVADEVLVVNAAKTLLDNADVAKAGYDTAAAQAAIAKTKAVEAAGLAADAKTYAANAAQAAVNAATAGDADLAYLGKTTAQWGQMASDAHAAAQTARDLAQTAKLTAVNAYSDGDAATADALAAADAANAAKTVTLSTGSFTLSASPAAQGWATKAQSAGTEASGFASDADRALATALAAMNAAKASVDSITNGTAFEAAIDSALANAEQSALASEAAKTDANSAKTNADSVLGSVGESGSVLYRLTAIIDTIDTWKAANSGADATIANAIRAKAVTLQTTALTIKTATATAATNAASRDGEADAGVAAIQAIDDDPATTDDDVNDAQDVTDANTQVAAAKTAADAARKQATIAQAQANAAGQVSVDATALATAFAGWKSQVDEQAALAARQAIEQAAANAAADAKNDSGSGNEDNAITVSVLGNDTRVDGAALNQGRIVALGVAANGQVKLAANGTDVIYTPDANFNGTDSFTYTITNTVVVNGQTRVTSDTATVTVTVAAVNDAPTLTSDVGTAINAKTSVTIDALANDADVDGNTLTITAASNGAKGTVAVVSGKLVYTPTENQYLSLKAGETGTDTFTYTVSDGQGASQTASVTVTVTGTNDLPVVNAVSQTTAEGASLLLRASDFSAGFSDVDGDALGKIRLASVPTASEGKLQILVNGTWSDVTSTSLAASPVDLTAAQLNAGELRFVPADNFAGNASFGWKGFDGTVFSAASATFTLTVSNVNDTPTATGNAVLSQNEDVTATGSTVSSLFASTFSDPDPEPSLSGIVVIGNSANATTQGTWQYSTDSGASWNAVGSVGDNATALALSAATQLRFAAIANYNGTPPSLGVRAMDDSYGGSFTNGASRVTLAPASSTAVALAGGTLTTTVSAVNDAPVMTASATLSGVVEDSTAAGGASVLALFNGSFSDVDSGASLAGVAVIGNPITASGVWQYSSNNGTTWADVDGVNDSSAALALSAATKLRFVPAADFNGAAPALTVRGLDNSYSGDWSNSAGSRALIDTGSPGGTSAIAATATGLSTTVTAVNDAPILSAARTGLSLADGALTLPSTPATRFAGSDDFTIVMDVKPSAAGIMLKQASYNGELGIYTAVNADGSLMFGLDKQSTGWQWAQTDPGVVAFDQWSQITMVKSGSNRDIYVNGVKVLSAPIDATHMSATETTNTNGLTFGAPEADGGFDGILDGLRLYSTGLAAADVIKLTLGEPVTTGLLADWRFNEGSGNTIADLSGQTGNISLPAAYGTVGWTNAPVTTITATEDHPVLVPGLSVSDVDSAAGDAMQVTIGATSGTLTIAQTAGLSVVAGGFTDAGTVTFTGTKAAINAALSSLTYRGNANFNGTDQVTVTVNDLGMTGAGGAKSASKTINVTVAPVNDAPGMASSASLAAVSEDATAPAGATVASLFAAGFTDVDGGSVAGVAVIGNPITAYGTWQFSSNNGTTWADVGGVNDGASALALSAATKLRFVPAADFNGAAPALTVRGLDSSYAGSFSDSTGAPVLIDTSVTGGTSAIAASASALSTSITALNDAPVNAAVSLTGVNTATMTISAAQLLSQASDLDGDTLAVTGLTSSVGAITDNGDGTFTFDAQGSTAAEVALTYTVSDGHGGTVAGSANLLRVPSGFTLSQLPEGEQRLNTTTQYDQNVPALTTLADGSVVAIWGGTPDTGTGYRIIGQRFGLGGQKLGGEFIVNSDTDPDQYWPAIDSLGDGFIATWQSYSQGSDPNAGIYGQRFSQDGTKIGLEFHVNTYVTIDQQRPKVAELSNGGFVVTWTSTGQDASTYGVYAQRYDADGIAAGVEFRVNNTVSGDQSVRSVTGLADGGFMVVWHDAGLDTNGYGIYARRYDAAGSPASAEFRLNDIVALAQKEPAIDVLANGGLVVAWQTMTGDGDGNGIAVRRFDSAGTALGTETIVNTTVAGEQTQPQVTALATGGYAVGWVSDNKDDAGKAVVVRVFDAQGNAISGEILANTYGSGDQNALVLTALAGGGFQAAWVSAGQDGSSGGIYAQRFNADGTPAGGLMLTGGSGNDSATITSPFNLVDGGAGNDSFITTAALATGGATFIGGSGTDQITITDAVWDTTGAINALHGIEKVVLGHSGSGSQTITLDAETVIGVIDASASTAGISLNAAARSGATTLIGGSGSDTLTGGSDAADVAGFTGNAGAYHITNAAGTLNVAALASGNTDTVSGFETLRFNDGDLTVSGAALVAGADANTLDVGSGFDYLALGDGDDRLTTTNTALTGAMTVNGGLGTDTLAIADTATITDIHLARVNQVESLVLKSTTANAQSVSLGIGSQNAGITSVDANAATAAVTLDASARTTGITLTGGSGADTLIGGSGADLFRSQGSGTSTLTATDTITGLGAGDVIRFTDMAGIGYDPSQPFALNPGGIAATIADIAASAITNKMVFFSNGSDGWIYVKGAGTGATSHDGTLIKLAGSAIAPAAIHFDGITDASPSAAIVLQAPSGLGALFSGGTESYLKAESVSGLGAGTGLTVEAWAKFDAIPAGNSSTLLSYVAPDGGKLTLGASSAGLVTVTIDGISATITPMVMVDANWHHLAVTWQSSTGQVSIYKDGAVVGSASGVNAGGTIAGGGTLVIGQDQAFAGGGFNPNTALRGAVDDVRMWNHARSVFQIRDDLDGVSNSTSGLVAGYGFADVSANTLADLSGNANTLQRFGDLAPAALFEISEDMPLSNLPLPFIDPDDMSPTATSFAVTSTTANGSLTVSPGGQVSYTPNANFNGVDSFTVSITDDQGSVSSRVVAIKVTAVNDMPTLTGSTIGGTAALNLGPQAHAETTAVVSTATSAVTMEVLIKGAPLVGSERIIAYNGTIGSDGYGLVVTDEGHLGIRVGATVLEAADTSTSMMAWQHVAASYNGTAWSLYVDGVAQTLSATSAAITTPTGVTRIGSASIAGDTITGFEGMIDDLRVWNTARSAASIQTDMTRQLTGGESGLAGYWRMDHGTGNASDSAPGNHPLLMSSEPPTWVASPGMIADGSQRLTQEERAISGHVTAADADGGTLTLSIMSGPAMGSVTITQDGDWTYTPPVDWPAMTVSSESFTIEAIDAQGGKASKTISVTVSPVNDVPVSLSDVTFAPIEEDWVPASAEVGGQSVSSLLSRSAAFDADLPSMTLGMAVVSTDSSHGSWQYSLDGGCTWGDFPPVSTSEALLLSSYSAIRFIPDADYAGTASFNYRAWGDGPGMAGDTVDVAADTASFSAATKMATITVTAINDAPKVAGSAPIFDTFAPAAAGLGPQWQVVDGTEDSTDSVVVGNGVVTLANREILNTSGQYRGTAANPLTFTGKFEASADDLLSIVLRSSGEPDAGFYGTPTHGITLNVVSVDNTITINGLGGAAVTDIFGDGSLTWVDGHIYEFKAFDDGSDISFTVVDTIDPTNSASLTAVSDFAPAASYVTIHNREWTETGGDHSIALDDLSLQNMLPTITVTEDSAFSGTLTAIDEGAVSFALVGQAAHGTVSVNADGTYIYSPGRNYTGGDSFLYSITDSQGLISTATASINVSAVDDAFTVMGAGTRNSYLTLEGTNAHGDAGDVFTVGTGDFTIEAWINPDAMMASGNRVILAKEYGDSDQRFRLFLNNGKLTFMAGDDADGLGLNGTYEVQAGAGIALTEWSHVAVTRSGNTFSLYIDGQRVDSAVSDTVIDISADAPLLIGAATGIPMEGQPAGVTDMFSGAVDDIRLWTTARSPIQIAQGLHTTMTGNEAGLYANWTFEGVDYSDVAVADRAGGNQKLDLNGAHVLAPPANAMTFLGGGGLHANQVVTATTGNLTMEAWVKWDGSAGGQYIVYQGDSSFNGLGLLIDAGGHFAGLAGGNGWVNTNTSAKVGVWQHVAVTHDNNQWHFYVDGEAVDITAGYNTSFAPAQGHTAIGSTAAGTEGFHGQIGEVRIWDGALTQTDIQANMNGPLSGNEIDLVGYWPLAGGNPDNMAGTGMVDGATWTAPTGTGLGIENVAQVLDFDGSNDKVMLGDTPTMFNTATIEAWVKLDSLTGTRTIVSHGGEFDLTVTADGKLHVDAMGANGITYSLASSSTLSTGQWYHVAAAYNGPYGNMVLYVNGNSVGVTAVSGPLMDGDGVRWVAGASVNDGVASNFLDGQITDVRVWDEVLTLGTVQGQMNMRLSGTELGLAGYWPLDDARAVVDNLVGDMGEAGQATLLDGVSWVTPNGLALTDSAKVAGFSGDGDRVITNSSVAFASTTLEMWFRATDNGEQRGLMSTYRIDDENRISVRLNDDGSITAVVADAAGNAIALTSDNIDLDHDAWHHVAVSFDPTSNTLKLYTDGVLHGDTTAGSVIGTVTPTGTLSGDMHFNGPLVVGTSAAGMNNFTGQITDVRVWDSVRDLTQITDHNGLRLSGNESGLLTYLKLNDGSGSVVTDFANSGDNLVAMGGTAFGAPTGTLPLANAGTVAKFDGEDGSLRSSSVIQVSSHTVETWVRTPVGYAEDWAGVIALTDPANAGPANWMQMTINGSGSISVELADDQSISTSSASAINDGAWHHVAYTYDAATKTVSIYVDGTFNRAVTNAAMPADASFNGLVLIGTNRGGNGFANVEMADVRVWDQARSAQDIAGNWESRLTGEEAGLVGYWPLNDAAGTSLLINQADPSDSDSVGVPVTTTSLITDEDTALTGVVIPHDLDSDGSYTFTTTTQPANGGLGLNADGTFVYVPKYGYVGTDSFTVQVANGVDAPVSKTFSVTIADTTEIIGTTQAGGFASFDGIDDAASAQINLGNTSFTWEFWANRATTDSDIILSQDSGSALHVGYGSGQSFVFNFWGSDLSYADSTNTVGEWAHWAGSYDTNTDERILYKNGIEVARTHIPVTFDGSATLSLGAFNGGYYNGRLDDVRIWQGVRSASEIAGNFDRPLAGDENGLIANWTFDDAEAGNDHAGGDTLLSANGATAPAIMAPPAQAMHFDGTDDAVHADNVASINLTGDYTIEAWFRQSDNSGSPVVVPIVSARNGTSTTENETAVFDIQVSDTGIIQAFTGNGTASEYPVDISSAVGAVSLDTWHHVSFSVSGTQASLYLDGSLVGSQTFASRQSGITDFDIGTYTNISGSSTNIAYFNGDIADVRVWNTGRTQAQIKDLMNERLDGTESGLVANWQLGDTIGTSAPSVTGAHTGTTSGAPTIVATLAPVYDDTIQVEPGSPYVGQLAAHDGDQGSAEMAWVSQTNAATAHGGTVTVLADGRFVYNPAVNYAGNDSFTVQITDGAAITTKTITVIGESALAILGTREESGVLRLDGVDDRATAAGTIDLANKSFSWEFWANRASSDTNDFVLGQGSDTAGAGLQVGYSAGNIFTYSFYDMNLNYADTTSNVGEWAHWAGTYDAATNTRILYKNGVEVTRDVTSGDYTGSGSLLAGTTDWAGNDFNGQVDNIRLWSDVRTADEIAGNYTRTLDSTEQGLLTNWTFDWVNAAGTRVEDRSNYDNPLTLSNGAIVFEAPERALVFTADGQRVSTGAVVTTQTNNFSLEAWTRIDATDGDSQIIAYNGMPGSNGFGLIVQDNGTIAVLMGGVAYLSSSVNASSLLGQWHHLAAVRDNGTTTLYVDGVAYGLTNNTTTPTPPSGTFSMGGDVLIDAQTLKGALANVIVWNQALSSTQVQGAVAGDFPLTESALAGAWRLDGATSAGLIDDYAVGGHNASISGSPSFVAVAAPHVAEPVFEADESHTVAGTLVATDDGYPVTWTTQSNAVTAGGHGRVTVSADGSFVYTPDTGFAGGDSFIVTASSRGVTTSHTIQVDVEDSTFFQGANAAGPALQFDGNDRLQATLSTMQVGSGFTVEAMINPSVTTGARSGA
ncbi:MAG: thrombospondin type 3 repeat protein outer membrane domain-containing, partial [Rhodospirillaceae bacterium]